WLPRTATLTSVAWAPLMSNPPPPAAEDGPPCAAADTCPCVAVGDSPRFVAVPPVMVRFCNLTWTPAPGAPTIWRMRSLQALEAGARIVWASDWPTMVRDLFGTPLAVFWISRL